MKGLVLAGGRGKRLNEVSDLQNKCMIKIKGIPVIEYNLNHITETNIDEIIIVVGYKAEEIINYYGNSFKGKKIKYVIQWEQKGLVNAIEYSQEIMKDEDFFLILGDEILVHPKLQQMIDDFNKSNVIALCGILTVTDKDFIKRTYTLLQDENNVVYRMVEKPRNPLNYFMGTGHCIFKNEIYKYIPFTPIHHERNEKELPDLIQCAIDDGKKVKTFHVCDAYTNINTKEDIQIAEKIISKN